MRLTLQVKILVQATGWVKPENCAGISDINPSVMSKFIVWLLVHAEKYCVNEEYIHSNFFNSYFSNVKKAAFTTI